MRFSLKETVNAVAFVFTLLIVIYGLSKGFNIIELALNLSYFTVLIISQMINIFGVDE